MILFLGDWKHYPTAEPNFDTDNKSFLLLAKTYKAMGIENYYFHLALIDQSLKGVNPFADDLTIEQMIRIEDEIRVNPWFFFREILRIKPQAAATPLRFRGDRGNIGAAWLFFNHITLFWVQPRQTGKSTGADALALYLIYFGAENTRINMLTKDEKLRQENIERLHKAREWFPKYLDRHQKNVDAENKMKVTCVELGNEYSTSVPRNNEDMALNLGRGTTAPIVFIDESPFIPFIEVTIPAMLASTGAARDQARDNGTFYGNIFTTTAGKLDTRGGKFIHDIMSESMVMDERILFDLANSSEVYRVVAANSNKRNPSINLTLSHRQLGKTDEWLQEKMAESFSKGMEADRDFLNIWTAGGETHPLPAEICEAIRASIKEPVTTTLEDRDYVVRWYCDPSELTYRTCTLGLDTSEAVNKDAIAGVLLDDASLEVLATFKINETNIFSFADWLANFLIKYPTITMIPERRSTGGSIIDLLLLKLPMHGINPFKRIYSIAVEDSFYDPSSPNYKDDYRLANQDVSRQPHGYADRMKAVFGFATSGNGRHSRNRLYGETLQPLARYACTKINDSNLASEINSLTMKNNRLDHSKGNNDDMVIAWLLAAWFLLSTRNLSFYGKHNQLTNIREYRPNVVGAPARTSYDDYLEDEQKYIREEISAIAEELSASRDFFEIMKLEAKLRSVYARVRDMSSGIASIEQVLKTAEEQRRHDIRINRSNNAIKTTPMFNTYRNY